MNRMRKVWKCAQSVLRSRRSNVGLTRKFSCLTRKIFPKWSARKFKYLHLGLIGSIIPQGKINLEDDLRQAIEDGEQAIVELMDELQDLVTTVSKEYRSSLNQQIELIQITGDEASHELLQFRAVADELNNELNEYAILLKAIGDIAYDQTMISLMVDANALVAILKKYKELEIVLLREFEANKQMELQLLQVNIARIAAVLSAMSCQKGNTVRSRPQKYKNKTAFKNNLHDTSQRTKTINSISVGNVCQRCKDIIEWKIKYKKYKPLSQLKTCVKCGQKAISKAYHTICDTCRKNLGVCAKCGDQKDVVAPAATVSEQAQLDEEMKSLLKSLPERKRRTFLRFMNKKNDEVQPNKEELLNKLEALKCADDEAEFTDEESEDSLE